MELWFSEEHSKDLRFSIRIGRQLYCERSDFQEICVFESAEFGRILTLDGIIMLTEKDEFIYHEMITHVAMAVNPDIKNVLIVGGGDGGAARELMKYPKIEQVSMSEIDEMVVRAAAEFLPSIASELNNPRVKIFFEDGMKFVRSKTNEFDLIIVDSTDPFGPGEALFTKEFYGNCFKALTDCGILINQHENVFYDEYEASMKKTRRVLGGLFPICEIFQAHIPTYPSGHWLFGFSSKKFHPVRDIKANEWNSLGVKTKYYNTSLHEGAFRLPNYVIEKLGAN